jgi:hypothetical protein
MTLHLDTRPFGPKCGKLLDDATDMDRVDEAIRPNVGDGAVCVYCAAPLVFKALDGGGLVLRELSRKDWLALDVHARTLLARLLCAANMAIKEGRSARAPTKRKKQ